MTVLDNSARAAQLSAERVPFVYATVVRALAPTSARPGDTAVVHADGTFEGFVGGVCAESSVRLYSLRSLENGAPLLLRIVPDELSATTDDAPAADGTVTVSNPCLSGGAIEVFLEPRVPAPRLLVLGETPIAHALVELGRPLGYLVQSAGGSVAAPSADDAGLVVASHGRDEAGLLEAALNADVRYVALVASRRRGAEVLATLDVDEARKARVRTPAGLWIGARTPAEVALSILAELIAVRADVDPAHGANEKTPVSAGESDEPAGPGVVTAVDPSCGMTVAAVPQSLHVVGAGGATSYFCGEGCRTAYLARA